MANKTQSKVLPLSIAKKFDLFDDLEIRNAENQRQNHIKKLNQSPPSIELTKLADKLSEPANFEKEFLIFDFKININDE